MDRLTFIAPPRMSAPAFAKVLTVATSPCAPIAGECYGVIAVTGLDPAVALAFFGHESIYGTAGVAIQTRNWGNVRTAMQPNRAVGVHPSNFVIFGSWLDGLKDWCERIQIRYIQQRGLLTVDAAIPVYAPSSDGNNTQRYIQHVYELVARYRTMS